MKEMLDLNILNKLAIVDVPVVISSTGEFYYDKRVPYNIDTEDVVQDAKYRGMNISLLVEQYSIPIEKCISMVATIYLARHTRQEYDLFLKKHKDNKDLIAAQHDIYNVCRTLSELITNEFTAREEVAKAIFTSTMIALIFYKEPELVTKINIAYLSQVEILCDILMEFESPARDYSKGSQIPKSGFNVVGELNGIQIKEWIDSNDSKDDSNRGISTRISDKAMTGVVSEEDRLYGKKNQNSLDII